jgi:hypothetical protein
LRKEPCQSSLSIADGSSHDFRIFIQALVNILRIGSALGIVGGALGVVGSALGVACSAVHVVGSNIGIVGSTISRALIHV